MGTRYLLTRTATLAGALAACNGILGIESNYHLAPNAAGMAGMSSAGRGGGNAAGSAGRSGGSSGSASAADGGSGGSHAGEAGEGGGGGTRSGGAAGNHGGGEAGSGAEAATAGDAGAGTGGAPAPPAIATIYGPCATAPALACSGYAQQERLACDGKQWQPNGVCPDGKNCDTRPGATAGTCQSVLAQCSGKMPADLVCDGMEVVRCGPDLVTIKVDETCKDGTEFCSGSACQKCGAGTANCDDDAGDCETDLTFEATCGTSCSNRLACSEVNGTPVCSEAKCEMTCVGPYGDCGGENDGCETDLSAVEACGVTCDDAVACDGRSDPTCVNGGCRMELADWPMPNSPTADPDAPNPQSYTDEGDGTVRDNVTGLVWEQSPSTTNLSGDAAAEHCSGLILAGHRDWRVPSFIELTSIVDYGSTPAIDLTVFTVEEAVYVYIVPQFTSGAWILGGIDFRNGEEVDGGFRVRCVR